MASILEHITHICGAHILYPRSQIRGMCSKMEDTSSFEIFQCTSDKRRGLAKRHISNYHVCGNPWEHVKLQILIQEAWVDPPGEVDGAGPQTTH